VHPCGIDATRPRGHTSLAGAVDAQIAVKRDTADNILVTVERMKDGPDGESLLSRLDPLEVGLNSDNDPISSCVVVALESTATPVARELTNRQRLAMEALHEAAWKHGRLPPAEYELPQGIKVVTADQWKDELHRQNILENVGNPRARYAELRNSLRTRKIIGVRDQYVWSAITLR
jgi:hypothetical protein